MFVDKLMGTPVSAEQGSIFVATNKTRLVWLIDENTGNGETFSLQFNDETTETIVLTEPALGPDHTRGISRPSTLEEITAFAMRAVQERPNEPITHRLLEHVSRRIEEAAETLGMTVISQTTSTQEVQPT